MDGVLEAFIRSSMALLEEDPHSGRYYHTLTPADNSPSVVHDRTNQLTYVISGKGVAYLDGLATDLNQNAAVFISEGTVHSFVATEGELTLFHIHIPDVGRDEDRRIVCGDDYDRYVM